MIPGSKHHNPLLAGIIPDHFWVTEIFDTGVGDNWISFILYPSTAFVITVCDALILKINSIIFRIVLDKLEAFCVFLPLAPPWLLANDWPAFNDMKLMVIIAMAVTAKGV